MSKRRRAAPRYSPGAYTKKFFGPYAHRTIKGGIGHNLSQEAPNSFADAILQVGRSDTHRLPHRIVSALPIEEMDVPALSDRARLMPRQGAKTVEEMPRLIIRETNPWRHSRRMSRCASAVLGSQKIHR